MICYLLYLFCIYSSIYCIHGLLLEFIFFCWAGNFRANLYEFLWGICDELGIIGDTFQHHCCLNMRFELLIGES